MKYANLKKINIMIPLICGIWGTYAQRNRKWSGIARDWGKGNGELFSGYRVSVFLN